MIKSNNTEKKEIPSKLLKKIKKLEIKSKNLVSESLSGAYHSLFRGEGLEFEEVREYFPGDDYRRIDWNVTARNLSPFVKRFREERQLNFLLMVDISGSMNYSSSEDFKRTKMVEIVALLAFTALSNNDRIGGLFFSDKVDLFIAPSQNRNNIHRIIRDALYVEPYNSGTDINSALNYSLEMMKRRGIIVILSDFFSDVDEKLIYMLSKKHDVIPVVIEDDFEIQQADIGIVTMIDNETKKTVNIDTSSHAYKKYIKDRIDKRNSMINMFKKYNIESMIVNTKDDIDKKLREYFHKRKKRMKV